jgi:curved DNA-binding protein CbpA
MPAFVDHYAVLGLDPTATTAEIRRAFHRLVAHEHADRHGSDPGAAERTVQLNLARDLLVDPHRRARFDRERRLQAAAAGGSHDPLLDTLSRTFGAAPPPRPTPAAAARIAPAPAWLRAAAAGVLAAVAAVGVGASVGVAIREARARQRSQR